MAGDNASGGTLTEEAHRRIEEMIVTLEIAPGEAVSETSLSNRIGIGTTPIREALQRLAREHLVEIFPRRGVVVTNVDVRQQLEVLETRRVLDRLIARAAARRSTAAERKVIGELVLEIDKSVAENDVKGFLRLGGELNKLLAKAARNSIAAGTVATLFTVSRRFWYFHLGHEGDFAETARLYAAVASAVAAGDEDAAGETTDRLIDFLVRFANLTLPVD